MPDSDPSSADSTTPQPTDQVGAGAPAPAKCRAEAIGFDARSAWCLVKSPKRCRFSTPFADRFLCCHPQRERIVARTLAEKRSRRH